jgi:hypothetical protein
MEEIQQLRRRIAEQVLQRAEADPEWRRQFLEDPETAMGAIPQARQLQERLESGQQPPEEQILPQAPIAPTAQEEYRKLSRSLSEKILDRAASDPAWKQQLLNNPQAALQAANFPELKMVEEMRQRAWGSQVGAEVRGQFGYTPDRVDTMSMSPIDPYPWYPTHAWWNCCQFYTQ